MMPEPISAQRGSLAKRVCSAPKVLLFTDFDGTLVPIKARPTECCLDPAIGRLLSALAGQERVAVGIVSGRELEDLRTRVGVDGIAYAGNHGLEIEGPGFSFREPNAERLSRALHGLLGDLEHSLTEVPGAWIQDKGLSASIHYRQVAPADVPHLIDMVRSIAAPCVAAQQVVLRGGKMVLEIRPAGDWHKGKAVGWLTGQMSSDCTKPLLIYLGDDTTDEDVFAALPEEITIRVGDHRSTSANYTVRDPGEVHAFLSWLLNVIVDSRSLNR